MPLARIITATRFADWAVLTAQVADTAPYTSSALLHLSDVQINGGSLPKESRPILSQPLLIDRNLSWHAWFKSAGAKLDRDIAGTFFTDTNADGSCVTGQGIALGRLLVARLDIPAGKLVRLRVAYCHHVVYPIASDSNPAIVIFRDWLKRRVVPRKAPLQRACRLWKEAASESANCSPCGKREPGRA